MLDEGIIGNLYGFAIFQVLNALREDVVVERIGRVEVCTTEATVSSRSRIRSWLSRYLMDVPCSDRKAASFSFAVKDL